MPKVKSNSSADGQWSWRIVAILLALLGPFPIPSVADDANNEIQHGLEDQEAGRFRAADRAFANAQALLPDEPKLAFNRGCALAGQGDFVAAREMFLSAALSKDRDLIAASRYNLGNLVAKQARFAFGEPADKADAEARQAGAELLGEAIEHYRECLSVKPNHVNARHNLELLVLWIERIKTRWAELDRARRREEMDTFAFLEFFWTEQRLYRASVGELRQQRQSPLRRQRIRELADKQRLLAEETLYLIDKVASMITSQQDPSNPVDPRQIQDALARLVAKASQPMREAATKLDARQLDVARQQQTAGIRELDTLFKSLAPLEALLQRAVDVQESLVARTKREIDEATSPATGVELLAGASDSAEAQTWVAGWVDGIQLRAKAGLASLASSAESGTEPPAGSNAASPAGNDPPADPEAARRKMLETALRNGPLIQELSKSTVSHLGRAEWKAAFPDQEEILRLLREIAQSMSNENQQQQPNEQPQDSDQQNQEDQNQSGDSEEKDEPGEQSEPGEQGDSGDSKDQQQESQDQAGESPTEQEEEQRQDDQKQNSEGENEKAPEDSPEKRNEQSAAEETQEGENEESGQQVATQSLSRRQAEAILRQVREREREFRERQKRVQRYLQRGAKVDRDW